MKPKEAFLQNIKAKIKVLQDAYDFNKSLPDDVFESLFDSSNNGRELSLDTPKVAISAENHNGFEKIDITGYGAKREIVKGVIAAKAGGTDKKSIVSYLQSNYDLEKNKAGMMVTNTVTALIKDNEIEAIKRGKYRIKKK